MGQIDLGRCLTRAARSSQRRRTPGGSRARRPAGSDGIRGFRTLGDARRRWRRIRTGRARHPGVRRICPRTAAARGLVTSVDWSIRARSSRSSSGRPASSSAQRHAKVTREPCANGGTNEKAHSLIDVSTVHRLHQIAFCKLTVDIEMHFASYKNVLISPGCLWRSRDRVMAGERRLLRLPDRLCARPVTEQPLDLAPHPRPAVRAEASVSEELMKSPERMASNILTAPAREARRARLDRALSFDPDNRRSRMIYCAAAEEDRGDAVLVEIDPGGVGSTIRIRSAERTSSPRLPATTSGSSPTCARP